MICLVPGPTLIPFGNVIQSVVSITVIIGRFGGGDGGGE